MSMCVLWVHGCVYASVRVRAYMLLRLPISPRLAFPRLAPPPNPFSHLSCFLLAPASFPLACFLSPPLASPVPCYPLPSPPFPSLPFRPRPTLPSLRPSCPSLRSSLLCRILLSLRPACSLSLPLASPVPCYPLRIPSLPFSSLPSSPLPPLASHLLASPLLSPLPSPPCAGISAKYVPLRKSGLNVKDSGSQTEWLGHTSAG